MLTILVPPTRGGIFDFGTCLYMELERQFPGEVRLCILQRGFDTPLKGDDVLLQCNAYGFHPRGVPLWLLDLLRKERRSFRSFGVYFHELFAFGAPWRSSFWLNPVQKYIALRIADMADYRMTNREASGRWLDAKLRDGHGTHVLPVFATIGEPSVNVARLDFSKRSGIAVFGGTGVRSETYLVAGEKLFASAVELGMQVHDIGPPIGDPTILDWFTKYEVVVHGALPPLAVGNLLLDCRFGVVSYLRQYVAKSSVFGAYCAYGVMPILLSNEHVGSDGLIDDLHFVSTLEKIPFDTESAEMIARAATVWYSAHSLPEHLGLIRYLLKK
jgi:hypothetical protein